MFEMNPRVQELYRRDGTASSAQAREAGMRARTIAEAAWRQVEAHFPAGLR